MEFRVVILVLSKHFFVFSTRVSLKQRAIKTRTPTRHRRIITPRSGLGAFSARLVFWKTETKARTSVPLPGTCGSRRARPVRIFHGAFHTTVSTGTIVLCCNEIDVRHAISSPSSGFLHTTPPGRLPILRCPIRRWVAGCWCPFPAPGLRLAGRGGDGTGICVRLAPRGYAFDAASLRLLPSRSWWWWRQWERRRRRRPWRRRQREGPCGQFPGPCPYLGKQSPCAGKLWHPGTEENSISEVSRSII